MIAMPVAMPTRHCSGAPAPCRSGADRRAQCEPGTDRLLGVVFLRHGIAKQDERGIAEMVDHEPAVAIDRFRDATLKSGDRVTQVFETDAVGAPRRSDQLAGHGGDLPPFGVGARPGGGLARDPARRRPSAARWRPRPPRQPAR